MTTFDHAPGAGTIGANDELSLVDLVDRLLEKGAAICGDVVLSVAGIDLVRLGLRAVLEGIDDPSGEAPRPAVGSPEQARCSPAPRHDGTQVTGGTGGRVAAPVPLESRRRRDRVALDTDDVERGLVQLVLTVVELLREVLERQALRRVDAGALRAADVERLGRAFMELEARMADLKEQFGLSDDDVRLRLGVVRDAG